MRKQAHKDHGKVNPPQAWKSSPSASPAATISSSTVQQQQQKQQQVPAVPPTTATTSSRQESKKPKFVNLMSHEGQDRISELVPGRHVCECQASRHKLVNNCTECGRIVCEQEGSGPCFFCSALVCTNAELDTLHRDSRKSEKLREKLLSQGLPAAAAILDKARALYQQGVAKEGGENFHKAMEHKDRLIQYDRSSARRTKVIDDQSDYFNTDSNKYATPCDDIFTC